MPYREFSLLPVYIHEGFGKIPAPFRVDYGIEGAGGAVSIPQGKDGIPGVGSRIAEAGGRQKCMIQSGIEDPALLFVQGFDAYAPQGLVPLSAGPCDILFEVVVLAGIHSDVVQRFLRTRR